MATFNQAKIQKLKKIDKFLKPFFISKVHNNLSFEKGTKSILIIGFFLIGDTIMYLSALRTLRKNFPNANITLVGSKIVKTILEGQSVVDNFVVVECPWIGTNNKSLKNIFNFLKGIWIANRNNKYDIAIEFRGDWRNIFYMNYIRAKRKVSYNFTGGEYMLTDVFLPEPTIDHFTDESFCLLKQMGCEFTEEDTIPILLKNNKSRFTQEKFITDHQIANKFIVGLHPGASLAIKQWDVLKYAELICQLHVKSKNLMFLVFEGPGEQQTVIELTAQLDLNCIPYIVVKRPLVEYIDLIGICNLMICNDSGAAHIAAAFSIPTVVIFANVDPKYVTPKSSGIVRVISHSLHCKPCLSTICKYNTNECIKTIEVKEVLILLNEILSSKNII